MTTNPKPNDIRSSLYRDRTKMDSNTHTPESPGFLEMKRGVARLTLEEHETLVRQLLNFGWK